MIIIKQMNVP